MHTGDVRVDVQAALAMLTPIWGYRPLLDITAEEAREELARAAVMALSYVAQSARGIGTPAVPQKRVDEAATIVERFMIRWRGEPDPAHVAAVDAYWTSAAEHGMNASTFTARVIASTGADVAASLSGAIGAMSGPLHGGAPSRVLHMLDDVEKTGDAEKYVKDLLDRKERLMGFGHRVYRAEDPRARVLRRSAEELGAPRFEAALALEQAALKELRERRPDRPVETNVEFWAAIVLDFAEVPSHMFTSMFTCARTAGWCAHILEQKKTGRLVRPSARYIGPDPRKPDEVEGWDTIKTKSTTQPRRPKALAPTPGRSSRPGRVSRTARREACPDEHHDPRRPAARPTAGSAAGRRRSARRRCRARRATAPRSWAPRTGRRRCGGSSARSARGWPSCSTCPTATRSCSATAGRRRSGTPPRSA